MMEKSLVSLRKLSWIFAVAALALCVSCGGGGNDSESSDSAVFLNLSIDSDGDFIEAEMLKDVATTTAVATISVGSQFANVAVSVGTVRLDRYEITFVREDGGSAGVSTVSGLLDGTISVNGIQTGTAQEIEVELDLFPTSHKLFSDFAAEFASTLTATTFQARITVYGRNLAGDELRVSAGVKVQAAVYLPYDDIIPVIVSLVQSEELNLGDNYFSSWTVFNRVDQGFFLLPWGGIVPLGPDRFPVGNLISNTAFLAQEIPPGTSRDYPAGVLVVDNPFGSAQSSALGGVTVTAPPPPTEPAPEPINIIEFFPDRASIELGESVTLSWVTSGGATSLSILPDTYSGQRVDLSGKNPAFDSVSITPDFSVRPILRAERDSDGFFDSEFLSSVIVVTPPPDPPPPEPPTPPEIVFFQPARATIFSGNRTVLFWETTGNVDKVELLPISGDRFDVTDVRSFVTPVLIDPGTYVFSLVVFGTDGSVIKQDTTVTVTTVFNQPVTISQVIQEPSSTINNGDQGSFRFTITDPERQDSSWRAVKIAGDSASFLPVSGNIPGGLGDASVSFNDFDDNQNGFLTFELSAYDDRLLGISSNSTRAVELVTFQTTGMLSDNAPVITEAQFVNAGDPDTFPGSRGAIEFTFSDPDTLTLDWSVRIVSGDEGGTLTPPTGRVSTGSGNISVAYEDDPDTPTEPVVFLIRVVEVGTANPQSDIFLLRVEKGLPADGSGANPTAEPISQAFSGLYDNLFGGVENTQQIPDFTLYTDGVALDPRLFKNSDLSGEVLGASLVVDLASNTGDPSNIVGVDFVRNFAEPSSAVKNSGAFDLVGYFNQPGESGPPSTSTIQNGVARYFMAFSREDFRESAASAFNLPLSGTRVYTVNTTYRDNSGNMVTDALNVAVIRP